MSGSLLDAPGLELLRPVPRTGAVVEVQPHESKTEPGLEQGTGFAGDAVSPREDDQQDVREPARWASRVSLLLLALRAVGFARSLN